MHYIIYLLLILTTTCYAEQNEWPPVNNFAVDITIDTKSEKLYIYIPIMDNKNNTLYSLVCRGGSLRYLDELGEKNGITYVPPLNCSLYEGKDETENSLLSEDDSPNWHSRGQVFYPQIIGKCATYPEFGSLRHFKLRGFELTLEFKDIFLNKQGLIDFFTLGINVKRNKSNRTSQAEIPYVLPPKDESCRFIRHGKEKRMCRDNSFNWVECEK